MPQFDLLMLDRWNLGQVYDFLNWKSNNNHKFSVAFSPDNRYIATGTHAGNINTWNVESGEKDRVLETKGNFVMSVAFVCPIIVLILMMIRVQTDCTLHQEQRMERFIYLIYL
jgi:WD40 repeat protein